MRHLTQKAECVRAVAFLPDGRLLSAAGKKQVTVWDPVAGIVLDTIKTRMFVFALAVDPNGEEFAAAGRGPPSAAESEILVRHLTDPTGGLTYCWPIRDRGFSHSIWSMAYTGDGEYLVAARLRMGGGNMYDGDECRWWHRPKVFESGGLSLSPNGFAVTAADTGTRFAVTSRSQVITYDHPTGPATATHPFANDWASAAVFHPNGSDVLLGSGRFLLSTDRLSRTGRPTQLKTEVRAIRALAVAPDGKTLAAGGTLGRVSLFEFDSRLERAAYSIDVGTVQSLAFSPDGTTLAVGAEKGLILVDAE